MDVIAGILPAQDELVPTTVVQDKVVALSITMPINPGLILNRHQMRVFPASTMDTQNLAWFEHVAVVAYPIKLQLACGVAIVIKKRMAELHCLEVNGVYARVLHIHPFSKKRFRTSC